MSAAIGKLLTQFDANGRTKTGEKPKVTETVAKPKEAKREPVPTPKAETQSEFLNEAYRRGYAAGSSEGEAKLAEERVNSAVRLGEERAKWSDQQAIAIVDGFAAACRELETNIEQLSYFDRLPEAAQVALLEGAIDDTKSMDSDLGGMLKAWSSGDVNGIARTFDRDLSGTPELQQSLIHQRNSNWSKWIEKRLHQPGAVLVAVGAGHLAGKDSVLEMLRKDGYKVRRLQ